MPPRCRAACAAQRCCGRRRPNTSTPPRVYWVAYRVRSSTGALQRAHRLNQRGFAWIQPRGGRMEPGWSGCARIFPSSRAARRKLRKYPQRRRTRAVRLSGLPGRGPDDSARAREAEGSRRINKRKKNKTTVHQHGRLSDVVGASTGTDKGGARFLTLMHRAITLPDSTYSVTTSHPGIRSRPCWALRSPLRGTWTQTEAVGALRRSSRAGAASLESPA